MFVKNLESTLYQGIDWSKVIAFLRKHAGLELLGAVEDKGSQKIELFCLPGLQCAGPGDGVNTSVTPSWTDDKEGAAVCVYYDQAEKE